MLGKMLENVRNQTPLVHNITNYVTVNDCANALLACGGSPVMADDIADAMDITAICGGLCINIGTLNQRTIESMLAAGKKANELKHPILLDPVGAGASALRTETALQLIRDLDIAVIRGNISEIKALAAVGGATKGVDADTADTVTDESLDSAIQFARSFSKSTGAVVAITGAIDIVSNESSTYIIRNGHEMMPKISGTGCALSAITTAYITANPAQILEATAAALCGMGLCGEIAFARLMPNEGNLTYRNYIFDAIYHLNADQLRKGANYELR